MSKLEELISELCPDGVEYKTLDQIAENHDNERKPITSGNRESGQYPYYGASGIVDYVKDYIFDGDFLLISEDGANLITRNTPIAFSISGKNWVNNHAHILRFDSIITQKFVEHYLESLDLTAFISGAAQPKLNQKNLNKIPIPFPPLPVQSEIVRILDNFTELTAELTAKLTEELTARKKQYEYYREQLLKQGSVIERPLRELCEIKGRIGFRGYTKNDLVDEGNGAISFSPGNINNETIKYTSCTYVSWEKYEESPEIMVEKGDILLCKTGSTLGKVAIIEYLPEKATINPQLVVLKQIKCNSRYLKYILGGYSFQSEMQSRKGLGSVPNISQKEIGSIMIPLHSDKEQQRIVFILDKLNQLCNDISTGLPAEIEARTKQYEYYRDKLLTFKELS